MGKAQFLNPSSMLTPGAAGALTMAIANTLTMSFDFNMLWTARFALVISFLFGLLVMSAKSMQVWKRLIYYVLNSLIIFNVAIGANVLGGEVTSTSPEEEAAYQDAYFEQSASLFASVSAAYAQSPSENGWCCLNNRVNPSSYEECDKWGGQFFSTREETEQACETAESEKKKKDSFFRPWFKTR